jgi:hypothetical protein
MIKEKCESKESLLSFERHLGLFMKRLSKATETSASTAGYQAEI